MTTSPAAIIMIGAFPPPLHGMAAVNAAVRDALEAVQAKLVVIDLAAPSLERSLGARLGRLPRVLRGLVRLAIDPAARGGTLYMSVSGGFGQLYEVLFLALARWHGMRIFLHHHSFAYLDQPSRLTNWLVGMAGNKAMHILLSPRMASRLQMRYSVKRVFSLSNAVFFMNDSIVSRMRRNLATLGFLSNIAAEKGVFDFLDLMTAAQAADLPVGGKLAGPFQDAQTEERVRARLAALPCVEYVGPKYGAEKSAFYEGVDALIFPTRYINEAEPLMLHEAMSRGIPVIAYGRGCIPEIIGADCGLVIDTSEPFVPAALAQIQDWLAQPAVFAAASQAAAARFGQTYAENEARWQALLAELTGIEVDGSSNWRARVP